MSFILCSIFLVLLVSLAVCLLFHEGKQKFLQTVLVQGAEEETLTFLRKTEIYFSFCYSLLFLKSLVILPLMMYLGNADVRYTLV